MCVKKRGDLVSSLPINKQKVYNWHFSNSISIGQQRTPLNYERQHKRLSSYNLSVILRTENKRVKPVKITAAYLH